MFLKILCTLNQLLNVIDCTGIFLIFVKRFYIFYTLYSLANVIKKGQFNFVELLLKQYWSANSRFFFFFNYIRMVLFLYLCLKKKKSVIFEESA